MMDRLVAHHPITPSLPKSFSSASSNLWGMQKEGGTLLSDFHLALLSPHPCP